MKTRNEYSTEFKIAMVEEFKRSHMTQKQFCEEKNLVLQTFLSWRCKYKFYDEQENKQLIEVSTPLKTMINESQTSNNATFTLEKNGFKMEFPISVIHTVFEAIKNDWFKQYK